MPNVKTIYLVVPCYNEEEVLPDSAARLKELFYNMIADGKISDSSRIMLVNDGSRDKTWDIIQSLHAEDKLFSGLCLSRNRGHQNAVLAGLMTAKNYCDAAISIDADLQDDIETVPKMVDEFYAGNDIVYGVRCSRKKDSLFKRMTAHCFYKLLKKFGVDIIYNHADYRLMSKRALDALEEFPEVNLFLRGIVRMIGFPYSTVEYERKERTKGESKYPFKKMLHLAGDGITSFSVEPIKMITRFGIFFTTVGFLAFVALLVLYILNIVAPIWSIISFTAFMGGIQLIAIGLVGTYVGKTYQETKRRPKYIIQDLLLK